MEVDRGLVLQLERRRVVMTRMLSLKRSIQDLHRVDPELGVVNDQRKELFMIVCLQ
jgi:hypothetical protein